MLIACNGQIEGATVPTPAEGPCAAPPLRDGQGRLHLLRGVNLSGSAKWSAGHLPDPRDWQLETLRDDFGFNALRFLVFWEAIEPEPGRYDPAYLAVVRARIAAALEAGFLVLVDMHQDVFGRGFGQAGAPRWSCDEALYASFQEPENWLMSYLQPEVAQCFDRLYLHPEGRAAFAAAWQRLAEVLTDLQGELVYDLLNEPFWGSRSAREFDARIAPRFYREVIRAIRLVDPWRPIAIEPAPTANVGISTTLHPPGPKSLLFAPHFYPQSIEFQHRYDGDARALRRQVRGLCADAARLAMPLIVGEVGARRTTRRLQGYLQALYDSFDQERVSAFFWEATHSGEAGYGIWQKDGTVSPQGEAVARPYPSRVVGDTPRWRWHPDSGLFVFHWHERDKTEGHTIVVLPKLAFPDGFLLELEPSGVTALSGSRLAIRARGGARTLKVRRRAPAARSPKTNLQEETRSSTSTQP
ncbi:MAG: cellulase family glycosylhydrolase [Polyangiales bacterium]